MNSKHWYDLPRKLRVAMCEIYPDSAPVDWILRLRHWHVPAAISPLHNQDKYDSDKYRPIRDEKGDLVTNETGEILEELVHHEGDIKKSHYHVMIAYGNATTAKTFMKIIEDIGGVIPPWEHMEVASVQSMYRYFTHMDDKDKYQYNAADIMHLGGFDPDKYITYAEKKMPSQDILKYIYDNNVRTYIDLLFKLMAEGNNKLYVYAVSNTMLLHEVFDNIVKYDLKLKG